MRQLTLTEDRELQWLDVADPVVEGAKEAVVRPLAVALCDLDQPIIRGEAPIPPPIAIGHEFVAEVVEVGEGVTGVAAGDRVSVPFQISCGECDYCRRGLTGSCQSVPARAMYGFGAVGGNFGGALSDLARVPFADAMLVPLPDGIAPTTAASVSDNIADAWRCVAPQLERDPGAEVLIVGGGALSIALYAIDIATALGAGRVVYIDDDQERLTVAEGLGAEVVDGLADRPAEQFRITVDGSARREGLAFALRAAEPGGWCTSVGILYEPETPLPLFEMFADGVNFHIGRAMARPAMPAVLDLIAAGKIDPTRVTSDVVAWDDAAEAALQSQTKLIVER
jgi:alcohol dehydrogenase